MEGQRGGGRQREYSLTRVLYELILSSKSDVLEKHIIGRRLLKGQHLIWLDHPQKDE